MCLNSLLLRARCGVVILTRYPYRDLFSTWHHACYLASCHYNHTTPNINTKNSILLTICIDQYISYSMSQYIGYPLAIHELASIVEFLWFISKKKIEKNLRIMLWFFIKHKVSSIHPSLSWKSDKTERHLDIHSSLIHSEIRLDIYRTIPTK